MERINLIKPYEISIWGTDESSEYKIAVIGSDQMSALSRACSPHFMRKSNGEKQLDFLMYTRYWDNEVGDFVDNPFIKLMCNERVVKLKYEDKWHDFIIKQIVESSDKKSYTYIAKDRFVQELSKTGFEIELDTELENNQGTNVEFATKVLAGTDWEVDEKNSNVIEELLVEPLFVGVLRKDINVKDLRNEDGRGKEIKAGQTVYLYYKQLITREKNTLSIIFSNNGFTVNQDRVIVGDKDGNELSQYYVFSGFVYKKDDFTPDFIDGNGLTYSTEYRGERLVRAQESRYDANLGRYVDFYKDKRNGTKYACFTETEYIMPETLVNLITNGNDFKNTSGWLWGTGQTVQQVFVDNDGNIYEPNSKELDDASWENLADIWLEKDGAGTLKSGLKISSNGNWIVNTGLKDSRNIIGSIAPGDTYILKFDSPEGTATEVCIGKYKYISENNLYDFENIVGTIVLQTGKNEYKIIFEQGVSKEELSKNKYGFGIKTKTETEADNAFYITNIQFFKKVNKINDDGSINSDKYYYPGETENFSAIIKRYYNLYSYPARVKLEEFVPIFRLENLGNYTPVYNDKFAKIRSISAKESNRFNLLQEICEKFECWMELNVEHDNIGAVNGSKKVIFKEYVGQENDAGFRYGINLKSIQRTLDSNQIATKLIVKSNTNEFGKNGFCTIARASENPTGENFLLDFDYYTRHNLLSSLTLGKDLYELTSDLQEEVNENNLCYYQRLKTINEDSQKKTEELAAVARELDEINAELQIIKQLIENAGYLKNDLIKNFESSYKNFKLYIDYLGGQIDKENPPEDWDDNLETLFEEAKKDSAIATICQQIIIYEQQIRNNQDKLENLEERQTIQQAKYNEIIDILNSNLEKKEEINELFFKKYASFIQEGIWNSEDYYDDNLYYLDAENTLYNSAFPKVTYSINVVEVSALTGYEGYSVDIGDRTYIEDIEFFGYSENGRPYQEEIVVNQLDKYLDEPTKDKISVKNYKNQFEDLFQRITAQTQSLQYHEGEYARSAAAVLPDGSIDEGALSETLANNNLLLSIGKNKSLVWDTNGFTNIDPKVRSEMVQITGGAIRLTSDGGNTWGTAITGAGINAKYIKTGQLDTSLIQIVNGDNVAFRWDKDGITAFNINSGVPDPYHFVRLDQYGIYGIKRFLKKDAVDDSDYKEEEPGEKNPLLNNSSFNNPWAPENLQDVVKRQYFGLTQNGLKLTDKYGEITFKTTDIGLELAEKAEIYSMKIQLSLIKPGITFTEQGLGIVKGITSAYTETLGGILSNGIFEEKRNTAQDNEEDIGLDVNYKPIRTMYGQLLLFNKPAIITGDQEVDNLNITNAVKPCPSFSISSLSKTMLEDEVGEKIQSKAVLYGSAIGNVTNSGIIHYGKGSEASGYYKDKDRGYIVLSHWSQDLAETNNSYKENTVQIKMNCTGIELSTDNFFLKIGYNDNDVNGIWYKTADNTWNSLIPTDTSKT